MTTDLRVLQIVRGLPLAVRTGYRKQVGANATGRRNTSMMQVPHGDQDGEAKGHLADAPKVY